MTLLLLLSMYVVLFVVVGFKTSQWSSRLIGWAILLAPLVWKTWDIPVGYYGFQRLCEAEAGLRVIVPNPTPAKTIRLDSYSYNASAAEEILLKRPFVTAVEAKDKKYDYLSNPVAFSLYERESDEKIVSRLLDKVGKTPDRGDVRVLESASSNAEYIFTETLDYPGDRMSRQVQKLRSKDGTVIGTSISLDYMWSNPAKTLFADSLHTSRCGPPIATSDREYNQLLDLIAPIAR